MEQTIARNNGHKPNWIHEIASTLTGDQAHEFVMWSNGSLSIDGLVGDKFMDDKVRLDVAGVRQLRDFLNSQRITDMLANS